MATADAAEIPVSSKIISDPIHGTVDLHPLLMKIIDTEEFQRLRRIKQLSGTSFVYPAADYSRFIHSIGVCYLAKEVGNAIKKSFLEVERELDKRILEVERELGESLSEVERELKKRKLEELKRQKRLFKEGEINDKEILCLQIAGLCHDLGHGPLSHVFCEKFVDGLKFEHEEMSKKLLERIFYAQKSSFEGYKIGVEEIDIISKMILGEEGEGKKKYLYQVIHNKKSEVDVDKWDYLARDTTVCGLSDKFNYKRAIKQIRICETDEGCLELCFRDKDADVMNSMFRTRDMAFHKIYQHRVVEAVGLMYGDVLGHIKDTHRIKDKTISVIAVGMLPDEFLLLDDSVFDKFEKETNEDAENLMDRINKRDLYTCFYEKNVKGDIGTVEEEMKQKKDEAKKECKSKFEWKSEEEIDTFFGKIYIRPVKFGTRKGKPWKGINYWRKTNILKGIEGIDPEKWETGSWDTFIDRKIRVFFKGPKEEYNNRKREIEFCRKKFDEVLQELLEETDNSGCRNSGEPDCSPENMSRDIGIETENPPIVDTSGIEVGTQTLLAASFRSRLSQTEKLKTVSQGIMAIPDHTSKRSFGTQTQTMCKCDASRPMSTCDISVQCDVQTICENNDLSEADDDIMTDDDDDDDDYEDDGGESDEADDDDEDDDIYIENEIDITDIEGDHASERKYVVFESCLKALLSVCVVCSCLCRVVIKNIHGSMVIMESTCCNGHSRKWTSQPIHNKLPLGNLFLSGGILFSGSSPSSVLKCLKHSGIATFTERTYRRIQTAYIVPAVENIWKINQEKALETCLGRNVKLGGDARCCSPGHTAKYGSYSLMDLETGKVLEVQLVQVTEVKNSYSMELEGLKRGLASLKSKKLSISDLTTDRHVQVKKYMSTEETQIKHWFDVWHMAKGVHKKIVTLSKKKGCEILSKWAHSISNHLYWSAATSNGDGALVEEKWISISNHVCNIHLGHGKLYEKCQHGEVEKTKWLKKGSKAHKELDLIISNKRTTKDIRRLSPSEQTSKLEAYHKVVCLFAPKFLHYFYDSMKARLLAAMHTNENSRRQQVSKSDGSKRWVISYPKYKQGGHVVKAVKTENTYDYIDDLMQEVMSLREQYPTYSGSMAAHKHTVPPPSSSKANRVDKAVAISTHRTRFNLEKELIDH